MSDSPGRSRLVLELAWLYAVALLISEAFVSGAFAGDASSADKMVAAPATASDAARGWPDDSNTGVPRGESLKPSGKLVLTVPGATVANLDISGPVEIDAPNVTLSNSRIRTGGFDVIRIKQGVSGVTIKDCEIDGIGTGNDGSNGIRGSGTFLRNNIKHVENGITLDGSATIEDNYIHDLLASGSPHYDGIQIDGGISGVSIKHNTVINSYGQTSAVMIDNYFGPISNIKVDNNRLIGGGYTIYSDGQFNGGPISTVEITNNRLGKGLWGYRSIVKSAPVWRGNVDDRSGNPS